MTDTPPRPAYRPARPQAHPKPGRRIPQLPFADRFAQWVVTAPGPRRPRPADEPVGSAPYTMLTTFRRDGSAVATPVWAARRNDVLYVRSERASGKVKRLSRDGRALVAPCSASGRSVGTAVVAAGRVLPTDEEYRAEAVLADRYGRGRALFEQTMDLFRIDMCYLELTLGQPKE